MDIHHSHHSHGKGSVSGKPGQHGTHHDHHRHCRNRDSIPYSWLGPLLGFVALPPTYWIALCMILLSYVILTHLMKTWFVRMFGLN
jgi:hypothetical protein